MKKFFRRYFSVSNEDRRWGLYVTSAGHCIVEAGEQYPVGNHPEGYHFEWKRGRTLDEFALLLIVDGKGVFEGKKTTSLNLQHGDMLLLPPGLLHRYRPDSQVGWEEYWVTFDGSIPRRWHGRGLFARRMPLLGQSMHFVMSERFEELIAAARQEIYVPQLLAALTQMVLFEAMASRQGGVTAMTGEDRLRQAADAIRRHPAQIDLGTLAKAAEMGESTFRRKFSQHFGVSPSRYAQDERVTQAKRWLSETPLTIRAISERLEFSSEFYFMRAFKRSTGHTPGEWRRIQQSKIQTAGKGKSS